MLQLNSKEAQHLSKSILLEESGNSFLARTVIWFSAFMVIAFTTWAAMTSIDEVAVAPGELVPKGYVKNVQHQAGGTISEILVLDGDFVTSGQIVLRLDTRVLESEVRELEAHVNGLLQQQKLLAEEVGLRKKLFDKGLNTKTLMLSLQRKVVEIEDDVSSSREQLKRKQYEINNSEIRATENGVVHGLMEHTVGGVIRPGSVILEIVPQGQTMIAEIRIQPDDIGHIRIGDEVKLKFDSYDFSRYGALSGNLDSISATTYMGPGGKPYYRGHTEAIAHYLETQGIKQPLHPGMTLTASITTGRKTVLEYILKPIYTSSQNALKER